MTSSPRSAVFLVSAALLAACGGRSQLRDTSSTGAGGGGSGPTTSSASASSGGGSGGQGGDGGAGGSGGSLDACVVDGPPIGIAGTDNYSLRAPVLLDPLGDGTATLISGWTKAQTGPVVIKCPPSELRHTTFNAWSAWPQDGTTGPSFLADYNGGTRFLAAPSQGGFGLLFIEEDPGCKGQVALDYMSPVIPGSGAIPMMFQVNATSPDPLFVAGSGDLAQHLLAYSIVDKSHFAINLRLVDEPGFAQLVLADFACAGGSFAADAAPGPFGHLVAYSSSTAFGDPACTQDVAVGALSSRLNVVWLDPSGVATPGGVIGGDPQSGAIFMIKVLPRADGAWIVWSQDQPGSPRLHAIRVDPKGQIVAGTYDIDFSGDIQSLSAATLGDRLALSWSATPTDVSPSIQVRILAADGALLADPHLIVSSIAPGRTALLGSPTGKALIVSWTEYGDPASKLRMARLACSLP